MAALTVFSSNSTRALLDELIARYAAATGAEVQIESDSAKVMLGRIKDGARADIALLGNKAIAELVECKLIEAASVRRFSSSKVGIAIRPGKPKPDISTAAAFTQALLDTPSIAHTVHGESGMYFPRLAERLGITERIRHKIVNRPGGLIAKVVAAGEAELAFQQMSELLAVPGVDIVGTIPEELQPAIETSIGVFTSSAAREQAAAFIDFVRHPDRHAIYAAKGLTPAGT